jgi:hypothetical protein
MKIFLIDVVTAMDAMLFAETVDVLNLMLLV